MIHDVIVIGSGPAGANAAASLIAAGRQVTLLDFGNVDRKYAGTIPVRSFSALRGDDSQQHRYFLGEDFEGLPSGKLRVGAQLTPPRQYVHADAARLLPVASETFSAMESLAKGGLGNAWGAGVFPFSADELQAMNLQPDEMQRHYETVGARIGVSGPRDDLMPFFGDCSSLMPGLQIDSNSERLLASYQKRRDEFRSGGFHLGQTRLAVSTLPHRDRGPYGYEDMDFWADFNRSVYRSRWTLEELENGPRYSYVGGLLVNSFRETSDGHVEVHARDATSGEMKNFTARAIVLAAGTLSTTRIVLRSVGRTGAKVPLLCNPYTYVPVLNFRSLGKANREARCSLSQLTAIHVPADGGDLVQTQFYSYRSLLGFKLLKEMPLGIRSGISALRVLMNALGILAINHSDRPTALKTCSLETTEHGGHDQLRIDYALSESETLAMDSAERAVLRSFRRLGCWPLKRISPGHGSSIHYAGSLPMSTLAKDLNCDVDGRLHGTRGVFIADGSVFSILPAKGLTFSIMANAERVGCAVASRLESQRERLVA